MRTNSPHHATLPWLTIGLVATVLSLHCLPPAVTLLEYQPAAVAAGQYWRLLTWHLVHWSNQHLLWDLLAFAILGALAEQHSRRLTVLALLGGALAISLAVPLIHPDLPSCRGLSGVDCALFGLVWWQCLSTAWSQDDGPRTFLFALVGVGFLLKTLYEIRLGQALFAGDGFVPLPVAHLVGLGVGLLVAYSGQWRVARTRTMVEAA